tara:strand:- start:287 stop:400 length:114 start_codon:yes stop_codon:yes gene_type:complete
MNIRKYVLFPLPPRRVEKIRKISDKKDRNEEKKHLKN